ncbi:MAG: hypothetical protein F8N37_11255 [Telmatospirillum sp.]|nr:hypothetical protein [Telmatospirillum sp.]
MDAPDSPRSSGRVPLPGFPGGARAQWAVLSALVCLVGWDAFARHGAWFSGRTWHALLWIVAGAGFLCAAFAAWKARR